MPECVACGKVLEGTEDHLCPHCLETADQSTTSFVPVGQPEVSTRVEHSPDDDIYLEVLKGPQIGERFFLEGDHITLGRDPKVQLFLGDITVSREHAIITRAGSEVFLCDAGSLNGTYLNGSIVEEASLKDGDVIQVGTFQLVFYWSSSPEASSSLGNNS